ncbi:acyltransferase family protein [Corynebacterium tapiri]|uniref:Acyltransferase n=1 Tax=Corynebacterium tapiri TaxID=1448266 RepID=A0A5C4U1Z1_9CORY|nr:acyltransferase [Corynebacterium tapiri]TNL94617.1 acyltransferase [Corynebacterium tapiri]
MSAHNTLVGATRQAYNARRIDCLEGLRAVAAWGVLVTHVAFQTGLDPASHLGGILARFDYFVAVFFVLSAFVLWRSFLTRDRPAVARYARSRFSRIVPAYLAAVLAVVVFVPEAATASASQILANLTLTQLYVPQALMPGLTHLWSLGVEVAFYLVLPLIALLIGRVPRRVRIACFAAVGVLSLGWSFLPFVEAVGAGDSQAANRQIWPPAYASWFAVGLIAAECEGRVPGWLQRAFRRRLPWWLLALACAWVASRPWFGPLGLDHPSPGEFARRILLGALFGFAVVVPYALAPSSGWLASEPMITLGRWSYSLFLWHVAVLAFVFPLLGLGYFQGGFVQVLVVSTVLSVLVAALSYEFIERPARRMLDRR